MKKRITGLMAIAAAVAITGCTVQNGNQVTQTSGSQESSEAVVQTTSAQAVSAETEENVTDTVGTPAARDEDGSSRTLIAYFTWADNTVVEDQEAAVQSAFAHYESIGDAAEYEGVDAVSSASVVQPGNVAQMAGWIQEEIGGDLFSIQVTEPYSSDYDECMERASEERADRARPELTSHVENMDSYDVVAIGYPNWWYGAPMAVLSFIENHDLSGKKILLFCSHGTGGLSNSVREIRDVLPSDCEVEENVIGIYRADIPNGQAEIRQWLTEIGY